MTGGSVEEKLTRFLTPSQWTGLRTWARQEKIDLTNTERAQEILAEAQQQLMSLSLMTIVVAVPLSQAAVANIVALGELVALTGPLPAEAVDDLAVLTPLLGESS